MSFKRALEEHDRIFCEGCKAHQAGVSIRDNPQPPGIKRITWAQGWEYAAECCKKSERGCPMWQYERKGNRGG